MKTLTSILISILFLCSNAKAAANDSLKVKKHNPIRIEIGILGGYNFSGNTYTGNNPFEGMIGGFAVGWKRKQLDYKIRFDYGTELQFMAIKEPTESVSDLSFLAGKSFRNNLTTFSVFAGGGFLWSAKRGELIRPSSGWFGKSYYRDISTVKPALAFECNLMYGFRHKTSTGICFFGNITADDGLFGVMLKVGI